MEEVFYCFGGFVLIYFIFVEELMFYKGVLCFLQLECKNDYVFIFMEKEDIVLGDIMIVIFMLGVNFVLIDVVLIVKEKGVFVIGFIFFFYVMSWVL